MHTAKNNVKITLETKATRFVINNSFSIRHALKKVLVKTSNLPWYSPNGNKKAIKIIDLLYVGNQKPIKRLAG